MPAADEQAARPPADRRPAEDEPEERPPRFEECGLDARLEKSIRHVGWTQPTLVQEKAIQFGLEGKDVLIKGRTGCGKTGAFLIPILHNLLQAKRDQPQAGIRALILSPSKELCRQTATACRQLNHFSSKDVSVLDLSDEVQHLKKLVVEKPDVIVATPSRLLSHYQVGLRPAEEGHDGSGVTSRL